VLMYGKTKEERFPSLRSIRCSPRNPKADESKITNNREYYIHDGPQLTPIDKDQKIRGYYYGNQLVPVPPALEDKLKFRETEKCMKLLGFASIKNVPRHHYMAGVEILVSIDKREYSQA